MMAADESSELLGHSINQFLLVSLIFPKLCKHVVLAASVLHPKWRMREQMFEVALVGGEAQGVGWDSKSNHCLQPRDSRIFPLAGACLPAL